MRSEHVLWLAIGVAVGYLVVPMVLSLVGGKKGA